MGEETAWTLLPLQEQLPWESAKAAVLRLSVTIALQSVMYARRSLGCPHGVARTFDTSYHDIRIALTVCGNRRVLNPYDSGHC